jgi:hypothetical protein
MASSSRAVGPHTEGEDVPWTVNVEGHPQRSESAEFRRAKALAKKILKAMADPPFYGAGTLQMHHGGSLFVFDAQGWLLLRNEAGIEWSAQFCADPAKVDRLRVNAQRLCAAFPLTVPEMERMGYAHAREILDHEIETAADIARWVDSIFNSCVPLPVARHVGVLPKSNPDGGVHHYPTPITDIELVKHDDYVLWVIDPESNTAVAVTPVAPRGAGVDRTAVVYADPHTRLARRLELERTRGRALLLGPKDPITRAAYVHQQPLEDRQPREDRPRSRARR